MFQYELLERAVVDPNYFGVFLVQTGLVDGMVSGAAHTTADTIRPAFEIIRARAGVSVVSSAFFMCKDLRLLGHFGGHELSSRHRPRNPPTAPRC